MGHVSKGTTALPAYSFNDDPDTGINSPSANVMDIVAGGVVVAKYGGTYGGLWVYRHDVSSASNQTGVITGGALLNPFGVAVIITRAITRFSTASTGACSLDIGVAADATTSSDTLLDGIDANATAGTIKDTMNSTDKGTNGLVRGVNWGSTQYVNIAEASGDSTGLVGSLWLYVQPLTF